MAARRQEATEHYRRDGRFDRIFLKTIRQTFWDAGKGFAPRTSDMTGAMAIAFAVVATIVTWVIAGGIGAF